MSSMYGNNIFENNHPSRLQKKFLKVKEATEVYSIGKTRIVEIAKEAGAIYKRGRIILINIKQFEDYLELYKIY